jgi:hypothetical protein
VYLLKNDGGGGFVSEELHTDTASSDMLLYDFDGIQPLELAMTNPKTLALDVLIDASAGTRTVNHSYAFSPADWPEYMISDDFNCDGKEDVRTVHESCFDAYYVGRGDGTFHPATVFNTLKNPTYRSAPGDFNGDGTKDVALTGMGYGIAFLLTHRDGTVHKEVSSPSIGVNLVFADNEGDNIEDCQQECEPFCTSLGVPPEHMEECIELCRAACAGGGSPYSGWYNLSIAAGDLNHDCIADVVVGPDPIPNILSDAHDIDYPVNVLLADPCEGTSGTSSALMSASSDVGDHRTAENLRAMEEFERFLSKHFKRSRLR